MSSKAFAELLKKLDGGAFQERLSEELEQLVTTQRERADASDVTVKGELQLTIKLKTEPGGATTLEATVKSKRPGPIGALMLCEARDDGTVREVAPTPPAQATFPFKPREH